MDIQAVSAAATVAVACAIVYLIAARTWQLLSRSVSARSRFADNIMSEAAQRFRDELSRLSRTQSAYLGAGLVFVVMYAVLASLRGPQIFDGYPEWQLYGLLAVLSAAALFAAWRLLSTLFAWRAVRFRRDAIIAVGHELHRIGPDSGRSFHDVPTSSGTIDHVLVGRHGVYAVNVVARRPAKDGRVKLAGGRIVFSTDIDPIVVAECVKANRQLAKQFGKVAGRNIRVRSVIAVPGWNIEEQEDQEHLLVNEWMLPMVRGWKDPADYLMDEEIESLQAHLNSRCKRVRR